MQKLYNKMKTIIVRNNKALKNMKTKTHQITQNYKKIHLLINNN